MLGTALLGRDRLAFRDVSHFYTPLYHYVSERTSQQWIPLWNPRCQTGMPLLGETTTAVLYPIRYAIGWLPMPAERQIAWYVALHLILASLFARVAAARAGGGRAARMVAGLTYPLSGSVFFLYCNPPFLVGAAWLPLAISMLLDPAKSTTCRRIAVSAFSLSMMVLAGDPQTALHVMMVGGVVTGFRVAKKRAHAKEIITLVAAAGLAVAMAAPQIAASLSWTRQSDRVFSGVSADEAMQYSIPPWHFAELFTPNLFGTLFPINQRISALIPGDGQMWTTTLFMGLLPALMLVDRTLRWRRTRHDVWLIIALLAAILAMGNFGLTGWLHQYFPGYNTFRYPAKWLPFFAIGLSMALAGWVQDKSLLAARKALSLTGIALLLAIFVAITAAYWIPSKLASMPSDEFWGPLDVVGACQAILLSLSFSLASLLSLLIVVSKAQTAKPRWVLAPLLTLLVMELSWSAWTQLQVVSIDAERSAINRVNNQADQQTDRIIRMQGPSMWPESWLTTSSEDRMLQVEARQRGCLFGRWHLMSNHAVVNNFVSIRSHKHAIFWESISDLQASGQTIDWNAIRLWLGVDQAAIQSAGELHFRPTTPLPDAIEVLSNWTWQSPDDVTEQNQRERLKGIASGTRAAAVFVSPNALIVDPEQQTTPGTWSVKDNSPEGLRVEVTTDYPALLVRPTYQDGHWSALRRDLSSIDARWEKSFVGQVDSLKQGIVVPPGRWEIRFAYQPWWWVPSIGFALAGWVTAGIAVVRTKM